MNLPPFQNTDTSVLKIPLNGSPESVAFFNDNPLGFRLSNFQAKIIIYLAQITNNFSEGVICGYDDMADALALSTRPISNTRDILESIGLVNKNDHRPCFCFTPRTAGAPAKLSEKPYYRYPVSVHLAHKMENVEGRSRACPLERAEDTGRRQEFLDNLDAIMAGHELIVCRPSVICELLEMSRFDLYTWKQSLASWGDAHIYDMRQLIVISKNAIDTTTGSLKAVMYEDVDSDPINHSVVDEANFDDCFKRVSKNIYNVLNGIHHLSERRRYTLIFNKNALGLRLGVPQHDVCNLLRKRNKLGSLKPEAGSRCNVINGSENKTTVALTDRSCELHPVKMVMDDFAPISRVERHAQDPERLKKARSNIMALLEESDFLVATITDLGALFDMAANTACFYLIRMHEQNDFFVYQSARYILVTRKSDLTLEDLCQLEGRFLTSVSKHI